MKKTIEEIIASLQEKAKIDLAIDRSELATASLRTPYIQGSWMNAFRQYKSVLRQKEYAYKKMYRDRWLYYSGKADAATYANEPFDYKVLKGDLHIFLESDEKLQSARKSQEDMRDIVKFVESVIGELNRRSFHIKNAIDVIKWENGG